MKINIKSFLMYDLGLLKLRYKFKEWKFLRSHYSYKNQKTINRTPSIVAMVDNTILNGGLGDRLHGVISLYHLSQELGMDFRVNFTQPFNLTDYFLPGNYNWVINPGELSYNSSDSIPICVYCVHKKYGKSLDYENQYQLKLLKNRICKLKNKYIQFHIHTNAQWMQGSSYSRMFHDLFKQTNELYSAVQENKKIIGEDYIGVVFRFQQLLGDFKEGNSPSPLSEESRQHLIDKCINKIQTMRSNIFLNKKILVTSDSISFLEVIRKLDYVYTIPGKVVHLSYSSSKDFDLHLKSFVDLMMLSDARAIYLMVTDGMFHSGFAKSASFINDIEYHEIVF